MDLIEAVVAALRSQSAGDILTVAGMYVGCPLLAHLYIQYAKAARRASGAPKLGPWTLRTIASCGTCGLALLVGWRLGGWPLAEAIDHAVAIGLAYPLAMTVYLSWLDRHQPDLAEDLGELDPTELRPHDRTDPP